MDDPPERTLVDLLAEAGRRGIPVSMLPEAIASTAMALEGEGTYSLPAAEQEASDAE